MRIWIVTLFIIILSTATFGQTPEGFTYQAVARDAAGEILANQTVGMQISILQGSVSGTTVFTETHTASSNSFGLINLVIGQGMTSHSFSTIDWAGGPYFIKIEMDVNGGTSFTEFGTSQLLSVPYSMHAKTAENTFSGNYSDLSGTPTLPSALSELTNDAGFITEATDADADPTNEIQDISLAGAELSISDGSTLDLSGLVTGGAESDPVFSDHVASEITLGAISEWNAAFSWGNHADAGYLTSADAETDPIFGAHVSSGISSGAISEWNTAFGWGDHNIQGYLLSESDPEVGTNTLNYLSKWDGSALVSSSIYDNGNVGIGTSTPTHTLHVNGDIRADNGTFDGNLDLAGSINYGGTLSGADASFINLEVGPGLVFTGSNITRVGDLDLHISGLTTLSGDFAVVGSTNISSDLILGGRLGVDGDIQSATGGLNVAGDVTAGGNISTAGDLAAISGSFLGNLHAIGDLNLENDGTGPVTSLWVNQVGGGPSRLAYGIDTTPGNWRWVLIDGVGTEFLNVSSVSGNVGIGMTDPSEKLEVSGNILAKEFYTPNEDNYNKYRMLGVVDGYSIGVSSADIVGFVNSYANVFTWRGSPGYGWIWRTHTGTGLMSLDSQGRLYLKSTAHFEGKVGIGNSYPNLDLSVGTGGDSRFGLQGGDAVTNAGYLRFGDNSGWKFHIGRASETSGGTINSDATGALLTVQDNGNVGIGTTDPSVKLDINGDVRIIGNLQVDGDIGIETIDVSQITGLLGQGFTLSFPDIINNLVTLEIQDIVLNEKVVMVGGIGYDIERITGFADGHPYDQAGLSMESPLVFETTSQQDANSLVIWFDNTPDIYRSGVVIIRDITETETARWTFYEYIITGYEPGVDGRTRFTLVHRLLPDNIIRCDYTGENGSEWSYNPATDKLVDINGITHTNFNPQVELDEVNRTITLTYDYNEGDGLHNWTRSTILGTAVKRNGSIIETTNGDLSTEISRINYYGIFPIKFEQFYGFGLNIKLKTRVVLSYDRSLPGI